MDQIKTNGLNERKFTTCKMLKDELIQHRKGSLAEDLRALYLVPISSTFLSTIGNRAVEVLCNSRLQELGERCGMTETKLEMSKWVRIDRVKLEK